MPYFLGGKRGIGEVPLNSHDVTWLYLLLITGVRTF